MKIAHILAATGLAVASLTASTSADAQNWRGGHGGHSNQGWHGNGGWHGGGRGGWGRGYRYGYGYRPHWRGVGYYGWYPRCWLEWHHGYRVRVCD